MPRSFVLFSNADFRPEVHHSSSFAQRFPGARFYTCARKNIFEKIRRIPGLKICVFRSGRDYKARIYAVSAVMHIAQTLVERHPMNYTL